jgi:hypothetical protein
VNPIFCGLSLRPRAVNVIHSYLVIDPEDVGDVDPNVDKVGLVGKRQVELGSGAHHKTFFLKLICSFLIVRRKEIHKTEF